MKSLILYDSFTGNTEKVVNKIYEILKNSKDIKTVDKIKVSKDFDIKFDILEYDLVFIGSPVIQFLPSINLMEFIKKNLFYNLEKGIVIPKSPKIKNKYAVPFVTFGGMHTGIREAIPALKYLEQYVEHLRFEVIDEFYIVGAYNSKQFETFNTETTLGDITGRPNEKDIEYVENKVKFILSKIKQRLSQHDISQKVHTPEILKFIENNYFDLQAPLFDFIEKGNNIKTLTEKESTMILIALATYGKCKECLKHHITNALNLGITTEEIKDIFITGFLAAGATYVHFGLEVLKELGIK